MTAMTILNKLFALLLANQSLTDHSRMLRNFLSSIAAILGLLIMITMMTGTLVVGGLYTGYLALLAHGQTEYQALSILGGITLSFIVILGAFLAIRLKRLRQIPTQFSYGPLPLATRVSDIGHAFVNGLMQKP